MQLVQNNMGKKLLKKGGTGKNKINLFWAGLILILIIIISSYFSKFSPPNIAKYSPKNLLKKEPEKIEMSGVLINDFNKKTIQVGKLNEVLFVNENRFNITYYPLDEAFLIVVTSIPFETNRLAAEDIFLEELGIDKGSACKLKVFITTPRIYNPNEAGTNFGLSFCE